MFGLMLYPVGTVVLNPISLHLRIPICKLKTMKVVTRRVIAKNPYVPALDIHGTVQFL